MNSIVSNKANRNSIVSAAADWLFGRGSAVTARLIHGEETISTSKYWGYPVKSNRIKIIYKIEHTHAILYIWIG